VSECFDKSESILQVIDRDCSSFVGENGFVHGNYSVLNINNVLRCSRDDKIYS